jgi:hypothetical protein
MAELLTWVGLPLAILVAAYGLTQLFWHPERNVDRTKLGHWFRSLIRLYESDAEVRIILRGSPLTLTLLRRDGDGARCRVVLSCPQRARAASLESSDSSEEEIAALHAAVSGEPGTLVLSDLAGPGEAFAVQVVIADIWSAEATDVVERVAERMLDTHGVAAGARFDLEFIGERSTERLLEARRRQRDGSLAQW